MVPLKCLITRERQKHQYLVQNDYELLESSPQCQVSWEVSLTNIVQPVSPQTTGCSCGQTDQLHVFLTWDIWIMNPHISLARVLKISRHLGVVYLKLSRYLSVILSPSTERTCRSRIYSICRWTLMYECISSSR
jgi:hypothetical protein